MPPVTGYDKPWPFFHFWRRHFWPKLASSILNFCKRKRSLQWFPDQSEWPNGAQDMHKNAQKVEWKTRSKISCHYTWLLPGKNCPSRWCFLRSLLTTSKPSRRLIPAVKRKGEKKGEKKIKKLKSLKPENFDFCACLSLNVQKCNSGVKKGKLSCCKWIFHQIKANLVEMQHENHQNVQKRHFWQKAPGVSGFNHMTQFSKDGSFSDKFGKSMRDKPKNARNSAQFVF